MTQRRRAWRIALLAGVAGAVDTFGYLALDRVFVTHMTGNTAALAIAIVQRHAGEAWRRGWALPVFFLGSMIGAALVDNADRPREVQRALRLEAALLVAFAVVGWTVGAGAGPWSIGWLVMVWLLGSAAGIQNAALTHGDRRGTHTTHLTGAVTDLAVEVVRASEPGEETRADRLRRLVARVAGFFIGGIFGALLHAALPATAPLVPAGVLMAMIWTGMV